jgi:hypothetical protein
VADDERSSRFLSEAERFDGLAMAALDHQESELLQQIARSYRLLAKPVVAGLYLGRPDSE